MANVAPAQKAAQGAGGLSPQSQAQVIQFIQQITVQSQQATASLIGDAQKQLDAMTGGVGKLGSSAGMSIDAGMGTTTGVPGAGGAGVPGLNPAGAVPGLTPTAGLDPTGGLGAAGGLGATPGVPGVADPTGLGAGQLASPLGGLLGRTV
ncbi:MAG: hypothetical protein AB1758_13705 [Candidatus Eremiobacterota bacterium]